MAARIGAANTLVRQPGGGLRAFNTDWSAAISAVEAALGGWPALLSGLRGSQIFEHYEFDNGCIIAAEHAVWPYSHEPFITLLLKTAAQKLHLLSGHFWSLVLGLFVR